LIATMNSLVSLKATHMRRQFYKLLLSHRVKLTHTKQMQPCLMLLVWISPTVLVFNMKATTFRKLTIH